MKIGYIRASTKDQNLDRQIEMMRQVCVDKVFSEKVSGKDMNRKELKNLLKFVREGDEIIVASLDRLGRDYQDIKEIVRQLQQRVWDNSPFATKKATDLPLLFAWLR